MGRDAGVSTEKLRNLNFYQDSPLFSADERLALELADAITATPARVTPELRGRLQARFSPAELNELAVAIGWENYLARVNRVFGFESEHFFDEVGADSRAA